MEKPPKKGEIEICEVPRWQMIKSELSNFHYIDFVNTFNSTDNAMLIDVRTSAEFESGHLEGAVNLNYLSDDLADQLEKLDISKEYFIYCRTGRRSLRICIILKNLGCKYVYNLEDGIANV